MKKAQYIIGIDEVGRGPLAGPVYVCAAMMKVEDYKTWKPIGLTDSKKMTPKTREVWFKKAVTMRNDGTLNFAIGKATAKTIDRIGITKAISKSIASAIKRLECDCENVRVELDGGLKAPKEFINQETVIKGDLKRPIISLASVIAKVSRDRYMVRLCKQHPEFCWDTNKGYGTKVHKAVLATKTLTPYHRKSYLTKAKYRVE